jgi:hypothetical protein
MMLAADPAVAQLPDPGRDRGGIQGRVWDDEGAAVRAVLVRVFPGEVETALRTTETDRLGYFHAEDLPAGPYRLEFSRLGFELHIREVELGEGERISLEVTLIPSAIELEGISVEAERSRERARFEEAAGVTTRELDVSEVKVIPGVVEADPLRAVEVLPGVVTTSDFSSAFNVRGGSADQNLILLDGLPIFNPTHLGGFFSVFNADMIQRAELQSGGFPAKYGGRVSSVLDVQSDPGDGSWRVDGGISLLATRVAIGGGLPEGARERMRLRNARWRVSGRRSYFDVLARSAVDFPYHLTDLQGAFEGWTRGGNRFSITAYTGRDVLSLTDIDNEDFPLQLDWDWGNDLVGARWTHPRGDGGHVELRTGYSGFDTGLSFPDFEDTEFRSAITQATLEGDLEIRPTPALVLSAGTAIRRQKYDNFVATGGTVFAEGGGTGWETGLYLQSEWRLNAWLVELGVRGEGWHPDPGSTTLTASPRVSVKRFLFDSDWAVKGSMGRYVQFLHSLRDEELPLGLDIWVLAGETAPHVVSDQIQVGVEGYPRTGWYFSLEGYYRDFDGVVTNNLAENPNDPLDDLLPGRGPSYGADLFLRRTLGATTGWLSLSWLRARRSFPDFVSGLDPAPEITYPPIFDRRVDVDLVLTRSLSNGIELGLRWNFGTGLPYTRPLGSYPYLNPRSLPGSGLEWEIEDNLEEDQDDARAYGVVLGERNGARYPARHRLDLSVRWELVLWWGRMTPYVNVINVYNQKNVLFYFFEYDKSPPVRTGISMFPLLPTIGVEVSF